MKRRYEKPLTGHEIKLIGVMAFQAKMYAELGIYRTVGYAIKEGDVAILADLQNRGYIDPIERIGGELDGAVLCPPTPKGVSALVSNRQIYADVHMEAIQYYTAQLKETQE